MKPELKVKLIHHLNRSRNEKGFTLVELLVVIIIIGILAAIALPSFLNQTAKAKQTEAKQNIGITNRYQTAYRYQNQQFASSFDLLAIGTLSSSTGIAATTQYDYTLTSATDSATMIATARDVALKAYSGANSRYTNSANHSVITSVMCEAIATGTTTAVAPTIFPTAAPICPATGYVQISS
ncbi:type IV pilin-like G/H family protein [Chamaesiphon sp.]|uniref:type IV pilin-like G/H family protein n=1 Tax=Chamaesiphon sp. TaxID=2814140 RepID=UPI003593C10A